jgi:hypothetical protein
MQGAIIEGEFDETSNEFTLQKIKNFHTESVLKENQLHGLYDYLKKNLDDEDGQIITLYDQMPVRLSQEEMNILIADFEKVLSLYHSY